jgi:tetratricopeptide (TPR) repeat protein
MRKMALPTLDMNPEELAPAASKQNENWTRTETSGAAQWQSYRCLWGMSSIKQLQIALQPVQTESYYQLGEMALDAGHDDEATRMFAKTLSRMPTHGGALTGVGILAFRAKNYAAARDSLTKAVAAAPDYQPAHYYLGLSLRRLGDKEGSARELKIAVDLAAKQQGKGKPTYVITPPAH